MTLAHGDQRGAEELLWQALAADPRWRPALKELKNLLESEGRPVDGLDKLLARPEVLEAQARKALRAGRRCLERGLLRRARLQFEAAARLDREHPGAWAGLGVVHQREERGGLAKVAYFKALSSPDPLPLAERDELFRWVAESRPEGASDAVLKRFLAAKGTSEAQRAVLTLGALGDGRVVPLLVSRLEQSSPPLQAAIAEALGRLQDPSAKEPLERLGEVSRDEEVLSAVQRALERLAGEGGS